MQRGCALNVASTKLNVAIYQPKITQNKRKLWNKKCVYVFCDVRSWPPSCPQRCSVFKLIPDPLTRAVSTGKLHI